MSLHTRSLKYGKLRNGQLVIVPPRLIRRLKSHFVHLPKPCGPSGVDVIIGMNGFVWVSLGTSEQVREGGEGFDSEGVYRNDNDVSKAPQLASLDSQLTPRTSPQHPDRPSLPSRR